MAQHAIKNNLSNDLQSFTVPEAAELLSISVHTAYRLIDSGKLKTFRLTKRMQRVSTKAIRELIEQNEITR